MRSHDEDTSNFEQRIADAVVKALHEHRRLPDDAHDEHHAFVEMLIKREARRVELWQKFRSSFVGAVAVALVSGLGWLGTLIIKGLEHGK